MQQPGIGCPRLEIRPERLAAERRPAIFVLFHAAPDRLDDMAVIRRTLRIRIQHNGADLPAHVSANESLQPFACHVLIQEGHKEIGIVFVQKQSGHFAFPYYNKLT